MRRSIWSLWRNADGAVAPTVALSLTALLAAGGIAFDYARMASMDTELQNAADQAALAAASQLDGEDGACERAVAAARSMVANQTKMANDNGGLAVTIADPGVCGADTTIAFSASASIRFYQDIGKTDPSDDDSNAKFVEVTVDPREASYALTPIAAAFRSGKMAATAFAGLGEAICKTPPLMICNPHPGTPFDAASLRGVGIQVTGHGNNNCSPGKDPGCNTTVSAWGPGDFGFLDVGGNNATLQKALAFNEIPVDCLQTEDQDVTTGNPQGVYAAINTRFDIYDFSGGGGSALADCFPPSSKCPAASNVTKDLVNTTSGKSLNCKIAGGASGNGWHLPADNRQFWPKVYTATSPGLPINDTAHSSSIDAMGLPRDNCHYASYGKACSVTTGYTGAGKDRIGTGDWARADYFAKNHPVTKPANASTITRYETYLWEIAQSQIPQDAAIGQHGAPYCSTGTADPGTDRRVLSVAVVENCDKLSGSSTAVKIGDWVDMFLVEPTVDTRGNGAIKDSIYMEVIGKTGAGKTGSTSAQTIRKAVPYLIE
jgi:Flp pilus assembly protein TadG